MARKILLADDSVTAQNMGRKILADAGYEVITVNNGSAALKKITEQKPDLIVLDVYMPGYSGLEVCQRLKEAQETSRVPVLLTVGKLEPFKPEEARRVRADGFIVKPFEASELLSALSKLEDKIVPRGEASKPGRFARATAAIEEGRYDKSVPMDEDSGWRNRIAFPSKKKEKATQETSDDPAIYNAVNKDLRTVVEHKLEEEAQQPKAEEARVDLGALAPEGLPKDVTPEEIAALAAAAAQVKGKIAESAPPEPAAEAKVEQHKTESKEQAQPVAEALPEVAAVTPSATLAVQKSEESEKKEEKTETIAEPAETSSDATKEAASISAPNPTDVMAAIVALESHAAQAATSGNGSWSQSSDNHPADEPITMAAAAGAGNGATATRWTAVSVALAPEEAAISLEQEMRQAYAAFAAAEAGHAGPAATSAETQSLPTPATTTEISSQVEAPAPESVAVLPSPVPEVAETINAVASAATDAIGAAAEELEAVASSHVAEKIPAESESVPAEAATVIPDASKAEAPKVADEEQVQKEEQAQKEKEEEQAQKKEESADAGSAPIAATESEPAKIGEASAPVSSPAEGISSERSAEDSVTKASDSGAEHSTAESSGRFQQAEPDVAETTAAAWANWRRIRESGDSKAALVDPPPQEKEAVASDIREAAAMAVAAGAEKHSDEPAAPESDADGIASIVDSVLADLRPKIVEEISRKMGKKK